MKQFLQSLLLFTLLLSTAGLSAQNIQIWNHENTENLTNGAITLVIPPGDELHEYHFNVIEVAGESGVQYSARRFEEQYIPGTIEYFCWTDCLPPLAAGSQYMREMQFGSFFTAEPNSLVPASGGFPSVYLRPQLETEGTALYRYEIFSPFNETNSVYVDVTWVIDENVLGLNELKNDIKNIYPVPASNELNVTLNSPVASADFQIINILGEVVKRIKFQGVQETLQLDLSDLRPGVYFLKENRLNITRRISVVR